MNRTLSFLFAAALGATIGALTALELAPALGIVSGLAATLGIIVGGLTGYITVDFRQFCSGVASSAVSAYSLPIRFFSEYWHSPREYKLGVFYSSTALSWLFVYTGFGVSFEAGSLRGFLVAFGGIVVTFLFMHVIWHDRRDKEDDYSKIKGVVYWASPAGLVHMTVTDWLPSLAIGLYKIGRWLIRQTGVFGKMLFIAVHSERRVLCSLDAMLGTLVGYYFGSWPSGTLAGLAFALVSYELISKRLLKLQTA